MLADSRTTPDPERTCKTENHAWTGQRKAMLIHGRRAAAVLPDNFLAADAGPFAIIVSNLPCTVRRAKTFIPPMPFTAA